MPGGLTFDPARVQRAAGALADAATALAAHESDTAARPDAGRSTDELAGALGHLRETTATAVQALQAAADGLRASATTYAQADAGVEQLFRTVQP
ncbi:MAG: hypothetical protein JWN17_1187 [Frankiales bacterium]|nr:hypothetical protein [Frankiales bacterium]